MSSPLLILTFCALLPAPAEADMAPVLAPAILVEEPLYTGDGVASIEVSEVADAGIPKSVGKNNKDNIGAPDLGPALVVDSNN